MKFHSMRSRLGTLFLRSAFAIGLSAAAGFGSAAGQPVLLRTVYALDDSRGYCIDVHGIVPRYHQSIGHNHESQRGMLGTAETNVSAEIIDFIQQVPARR